MKEPAGPVRPRKTFVLCFDGTGNKFAGDETDSNILKIYRMLDRADGSTFTFYQPGIGTYISSNTMQTVGTLSKIRSWYLKSKDAAVGSSFAEHVMGGYRFLMRYYSSEDDLFFFGFSRGAYTARFLAEMLDHVGLLSAGNEELARFAWKTYARWASRKLSSSPADLKKEEDMYNFMRGFRETFSRKVRRIRFLGLFDTVNSVPAFEGAWMQRSKFPYTARSSAKIIRHAVSIDERRAKFRQDLISGSRESHKPDLHRYQSDQAAMLKTGHDDEMKVPDLHKSIIHVHESDSIHSSVDVVDIEKISEKPGMGVSVEDFADAQEHPYQPREGIRRELTRSTSYTSNIVTRSTEDLAQRAQQSRGQKTPRRRWSDMTKSQDIEEVWFSGCHGDIGGGWGKTDGERRMISHVPLVWMVREAEKAGLRFDPAKMMSLNCCPDRLDEHGDRVGCPDSKARYHDEFHVAATSGKIHDCLVFGDGLSRAGVATWRMMEYLPFRRMDLHEDGSWKAIRWPLPLGETRDIPDDAQIHASVLQRMKHDPKYRPGNLIIGGGGRGLRTAPEQFGTGEWDVCQDDGDDIHKTYLRRRKTVGPHT